MTLLVGNWIEVSDGDPRARGLYNRHYSATHYRSKKPLKLVGPGEYMLLLTVDCKAIFAWRKGHDSGYRWYGVDSQSGVCCTIFRNEGDQLSSDLIKEADEMAWDRWPGERLDTYVNSKKIRSSNPGYCFIKAGYRKCGFTKGGLNILEKLPI